MRAIERRRAARALEGALDDELEVLEDAKTAHAEQGTPETKAAKKAAMESYAETRRWLRAIDAIRSTEADLAAAVDFEERQALQQRLADLHEWYDPLITAMNELAGGGA